MIDKNEIIIGKDILELVTSSMYVNPLSVYREYVQNSADAIDQAISSGILESRNEGRIDISIDHINRRATIRDNGIGINKDNLLNIMASFGQSQKRNLDTRGFRGVGRLAGLGYCQELVFRSRNNKDCPVYEVKWDCRLLKKLLKDHSYIGQLADIAGEVITLSKSDINDYPERFFEVDLIKPIRIGKDILLNDKIISEYLSQVAPVPISKNFNLKSEIDDIFHNSNIELTEYNIIVNESDIPLTRLFKNQIYYSDFRIGEFTDLEEIKVLGPDNKLAAMGWVAHHDYQGSLPKSLGMRGFRSRTGNIQVGEEDLFIDLFNEERFNSWTIGEIHIIDRQIIPNGRRDNYESNIHNANLRNYLIPHFNNISKRCRTSSQVRNRVKSFQLNLSKIDETLSVIKQNAISKRKSNDYMKVIGAKLNEASHAIGFEMLNDELKTDLIASYKEIEKKLDSLRNNQVIEEPMEAMPKNKRAVYQEVFDLIYDCSPSKVVAKTLIDKIIARITYNDVM